MRHEVVCPHCGRAFAPPPSGGTAGPVEGEHEFAPPDHSDLEDPPPAADLLWRADDDVDLLKTPDPDHVAPDEVPTLVLGGDQVTGPVRDAAADWVAAVQRDSSGASRPAEAQARDRTGPPAWAVAVAVYAGIATLACAWLLWQAAPLVLRR